MKRILVLLLMLLVMLAHASCNSDKDDCCEDGKHDYSPVSVLDPSCEKAGVIRFICSICQDYYDTSTPALGHSHEGCEFKAPKCDEDGITRYSCIRCDDYYDIAISATGHSYQLVTRTEYCWKKGALVEECSNCHEKKTTELNKIAHKTVEGVCTECGNGYNPSILFVTNITDASKWTCIENALKAYGYTVKRHPASEAIATNDDYNIIIFDDGVTPMSIPDGVDAVWYLGATTAPVGSGIELGDVKIVPSSENVYLSEGEKNTVLSQFILNQVNVADERIGEYVEVVDAGDYEGVLFAQSLPIMLVGKNEGTTVIITAFSFNKTTFPVSITDFIYLARNMVHASFVNK